MKKVAILSLFFLGGCSFTSPPEALQSLERQTIEDALIPHASVDLAKNICADFIPVPILQTPKKQDRLAQAVKKSVADCALVSPQKASLFTTEIIEIGEGLFIATLTIPQHTYEIARLYKGTLNNGLPHVQALSPIMRRNKGGV